jgi:hypothetical protein
MTNHSNPVTSFFSEDGVETHEIHLHETTVPFGLMSVSNPKVGIGGAYGTWGESCDNKSLPGLINNQLGQPLRIRISWAGSTEFRQPSPTPALSRDDDIELELG